ARFASSSSGEARRTRCLLATRKLVDGNGVIPRNRRLDPFRGGPVGPPWRVWCGGLTVPFTFSSSGWQSALITCVGIALVTAALALAKALLIPIVLAILLTFILSPVVLQLQRYHLRRLQAVLLVVVSAFSILVGLGWMVFAEIENLATELPGYRVEIMRKIDSIREAGEGTWLTNIRETIRAVTERVNEAEPSPDGRKEQKPITVKLQASGVSFLQSIAGSALDTLVAAGLVVILVIFMLI